jgi:radical SAM/Cys-rich protein
VNKFRSHLDKYNISLERNNLRTLQVNIGLRCNQACSHCHVEAGPGRRENMELVTIERILTLLKDKQQITTVDITGGAPELNPHFKYFVKQLGAMNLGVIDRCNLTVLSEKGQESTANFLAQQGVQVVASLPCYLGDNVDKQRGKGVFAKSIAALKILNQLGYADPKTQLILNLVYNPVGEHLPASQHMLERDYKKYLWDEFAIKFNKLFVITNMPIKRYSRYLNRLGKMQEYMQLLIDNFTPQAADNVMCKDLVSIDWQGNLYDCDFNQALEIPLNYKKQNIWDINSFSAVKGGIATADHCFACTAGCGSSCGGSLL